MPESLYSTFTFPLPSNKNAVATAPGILLIGPYDPLGGEYTFLAPPLGVWRLQGVLANAGVRAQVFDPNCCEGSPEEELKALLSTGEWDVIGVSTTGMTLAHDLSLAHLARSLAPDSLLIAGGMEATFDPESMFRLGPFDLVVLGEGELPLLEIAAKMRSGAPLEKITGTASPNPDGSVRRLPRAALSLEQMREAIFLTPYESMPYSTYWERLEKSYRVGDLPVKATREARLSEIRSVRLITLNYCPMGCTFCSSTNFLNEAQGGSTARISRLEAEDCLAMIKRITNAHPDVRTIIFQDDIFVFTQDKRILPLCEAIIASKERLEIPPDLQFISTNRIDSMNRERLLAMKRAGFRVLGFGVESFSRNILTEFNKAKIYPFIESVLELSIEVGITPFLDMIMTSPHCTLEDLAENIRQAYRWISEGCEVGMYPYVIPFSGAAMAEDPALRSHTVYTHKQVQGTDVAWEQASKILPVDARVREAILTIEAIFESRIAELSLIVSHLPSRVRSLLWIICSIPLLEKAGYSMPSIESVVSMLKARLPVLSKSEAAKIEWDFTAQYTGESNNNNSKDEVVFTNIVLEKPVTEKPSSLIHNRK